MVTAGRQSPGLSCVIGTRAQLIKMAPVLLELEARDMPYHLLLTGQHSETVPELLEEFGVRTPPRLLYRGPEISGMGAMARWFPLALYRLRRTGARLFRPGPRGPHVVVVHGDTFSTLLGALAGRLCGARVAHVESGLRSFHLFNPFPEELTRLACFRLAHIAYCPGAWAAGNLEGRVAEVIDTEENTLLDALRLATGAADASPPALPAGHAVASIHRFENLFSESRLHFIVEALEEAARRFPVVFVLHPATRRRLERSGLLERLQDNPRIRTTPRMTYLPFVRLLAGARCVFTDGGSNQEELSYLGVPTYLMREATERREGLGENVVLGGFDRGALEAFLDRVEKARPGAAALEASSATPSRIIVDHLAALTGA